MSVPIPGNQLATRPMGPRLSRFDRKRAEENQRKGMTLSEIAEELDVQRDQVVMSLYWDRIIGGNS